MKYNYVNHNGSEAILDTDEIINMMKRNEKIALIKELRFVSNLGLKDTKDLVEKYQIQIVSNTVPPYPTVTGYDQEGLLNEFLKYANIITEPLTKEEFMHIVENAIDNIHIFAFKDMLQAVHVLCHNIEERGGLEKMAKERDNFLNNI